MGADHLNVKAIFCDALDRVTGRERAAYLEEVCGNRADIRSQVEELLRLYDGAGAFLESPILDPETTLESSPVVEGPGTVIGRYKLLEKIGEGGMAVVYMAEQEEPIRRKVALKIIKLGMDTRQVIARFEAERQALALMDHPSIAKVLDAGATETGRPYFVMELVTGVSITEYCDRNSLSTKERLGLFIQVCNAVQHAHQKGIIHRDIKPSNVMVTHHDGKPVPKIIDFGIAKATNQRLTEKTLFTRYAHIIGTPAYMSPEQAELSDLDIDTRTDIYSLGVLLYELLTGTTPSSEEELRKAGYLEMQRVIREQEPVKPSTRLTTLGDTLTDVAKCRNSTPDLLRKAVRGDLDWIVMKSLEKERVRRYETPNGLAEDIRRHLEHKPILARGPGTTYRVQKFLRRHRGQTLAVLTTAVVAGAMVVTLSMWNRDRLQLAEAEAIRHESILFQAREQYARAEREAAMETLRPILTSKHVGPKARLLQATIFTDNRRPDEAVAVLANLMNTRPEIAGAAHSLWARILWESGSPDADKLKQIEDHHHQAEALLPDTAEAYFLRAMTALTIKEQIAALDKALQLDFAHYESRRLRAYTYYASRKYDRLQDDALVMTILRPRDPLGYSLRAVAWRELGRYQDAIADYDSALALTAQDGPACTDLSTQRRDTLLRMGDYERVIAEAGAYMSQVGAKDLSPLQYHAFAALTALSDYNKATALFRQVIAPGHEARQQFRDWCAKYVFDTLEAERSWHPADRKPTGAAFLPMIEAEETYRSLSAKGHRLTTGGFSARWSPDGSKLAFSLGVQGYSGVAVFDLATRETDLLIVPGKDPRWSPDGRYIAFVRDRQNLRLEELVTPEPGRQQPPVTDEEVWIMNSDGTAPRRLGEGSWPSWGSESDRIFYRSRGDGMLCSLSLAGQDAEPRQIMKCSNPLPSVSPDNQRVAYFEGGSLRIQDLTSQEILAECRMPSMSWGVTGWSPTGNEVCLGGGNSERDNTGLWLYDLQKKEFLNVLDGQITATCWSPAATQLTFCLGTPYLEIWTVPLDPGVPTTEGLGPGQTVTEHFEEMLAFYSRRIEADPNDAYAYSSRAHYYDVLHDRANATADMKRWSAVLNGELPQDVLSTMRRKSRRVIHLPFDCTFVFSAERPVNVTPMMSVAFGQKGRCEMKLFEIPMVVTSLVGLSFLAGLDASARADFTFGTPVNIQADFPFLDPATEYITCFSADGLEVYFAPAVAPVRSGGQGGADLWVLTRASVEDDWGPAENLGPIVNTASNDLGASITVDGLELYFQSNRPGGYGSADIYVTRRATRTSPWGPATNLGPKVNGSFADIWPMVSPDGLELYVSSDRPGGLDGPDIYVSKRATTQDPWGDPVNLGPAVNSPGGELITRLSPDGLLLFFSSARPGGFGKYGDGYVARRASRSAPWQPAVNLGPIVNATTFNWPIVSPDGSALYLLWDPNDDGANWTYKAPILPIVDFNADGKVDLTDLVMLIDNWGTDNTLYDIGPFAWGDGKVDIEDLKVFMAEWEKENPPAQP